MTARGRSALVCLLLGCACSDESLLLGEPETLGLNAQAIVGGTPSGEDQNAVVLVVRGIFLEFCTGAVVAPNLVLTARHCLFDALFGENFYLHCERPNDRGSVLAARDPQTFTVYIGTEKPLPVEPSAVGIAIRSSDDLELCSNDLALLELDRSLPVAPMRLRLDTPPRQDELGTLVGWGTARRRGPYLIEARQRREIRIEAVGPTLFTPEGGSPRDVQEAMFVGTEGACAGDNGGPLISAETGAIVGVMSEIGNPNVTLDLAGDGIGECLGGLSVFQRLDTQQSWLRQAFRERGLSPWVEGKRRPAEIGDACTDEDECLSGLCVRAGAARLCSLSCSDEACPDGLECVGPAEERVCVPARVPSLTRNDASCATSPGNRDSRGPFFWLTFIFLRRGRIGRRLELWSKR
jgi:hypothetical protein